MSPLLSAMRNGCSLLSVSIEIVVVFGGGIGRGFDVQPSPKLCQFHERSAGTDRSRCAKLVLKRFPNQFRFGFLLLFGCNRKSALQLLWQIYLFSDHRCIMYTI